MSARSQYWFSMCLTGPWRKMGAGERFSVRKGISVSDIELH